ncbi:hypothetical protein ACNKHO_02895 [Shigella flexneri]
MTGTSGCGKSTFALKDYCLTAFASRGEIRFEGKEITTLSPEAYSWGRTNTARKPQALFGDTVYDNLIFPGKLAVSSLSRMVSVAVGSIFGFAGEI